VHDYLVESSKDYLYKRRIRITKEKSDYGALKNMSSLTKFHFFRFFYRDKPLKILPGQKKAEQKKLLPEK